MPDIIKDRFYKRLNQVLIGLDTGPDFAHLLEVDRAAILEILEETKPEFVDRRD